MNKQTNKVTDFKEKQTNLDLTRSSLWQRLLILLHRLLPHTVVTHTLYNTSNLPRNKLYRIAALTERDGGFREKTNKQYKKVHLKYYGRSHCISH